MNGDNVNKNNNINTEVTADSNDTEAAGNTDTEVAAATKIQAVYRGYATRKVLKADKDNVFLDDNTAINNTAETMAENTQSAAGDEENSPAILVTTEPPDENAPPLQSALVKPNTPVKEKRSVTIDKEVQLMRESDENTDTPQSPNEDTEAASKEETVKEETVKEETVKEETVKEETVKEESNEDKQIPNNVEQGEEESAAKSENITEVGTDEVKTNGEDSTSET